MALSLVTAPNGEPVSLDEAKLHCRADHDEENTVFHALIQAAREWAETYTRRAFMAQTWDLKLDCFFDGEYYRCGAIWLPKAPVSAVSSVSYVDSNGDTQTWSADEWDADLPSGPKAQRARVYPAYSRSWPTVRSQPNAVTIRFVCGYATADDVPASIKAAMLLLVGHWYRTKEPAGSAMHTAPLGVEALLTPYLAY